MNEPDLQKLRVAVATADGWQKVRETTVLRGRVMSHGIFGQAPNDISDALGISNVPDYPADRNAIVAAILRRFATTAQGRESFAIALGRQIDWSTIVTTQDYHVALATATAEQLCRAYCAAAGIPATP